MGRMMESAIVSCIDRVRMEYDDTDVDIEETYVREIDDRSGG